MICEVKLMILQPILDDERSLLTGRSSRRVTLKGTGIEAGTLNKLTRGKIWSLYPILPRRLEAAYKCISIEFNGQKLIKGFRVKSSDSCTSLGSGRLRLQVSLTSTILCFQVPNLVTNGPQQSHIKKPLHDHFIKINQHQEWKFLHLHLGYLKSQCYRHHATPSICNMPANYSKWV